MINSEEHKFEAFTDGSAISNAKDANAGWAVWFPCKKLLIAKPIVGTNNQAELEAMRYCLWYITQKFMDENPPNDTFYIYSDSEYVIKAVTGKNKAKLNTEKIYVCKQLLEQIKAKHNVELIHVRAHTKGKDWLSINNAIVDEAARKCAQRAIP